MGYSTGIAPQTNTVAIKVPVFSTEKLPQVEVSLGPEMRSLTGEGFRRRSKLPRGYVQRDLLPPSTTIPKGRFKQFLLRFVKWIKKTSCLSQRNSTNLAASLLPLPALQNCLKITIFRYKLQRRDFRGCSEYP